MGQYKHIINLTGGALLGLTVTSGLLLSSPLASADNSAVNNVRITIPISCNLSSTSTTAHTATIDAGTYRNDIGESTITATCNDSGGFAIYAIGYSGDVHGDNTLINTTNENQTIASGTATSGATSNWAMKLTAVTGTYEPTIESAFQNYTTIPIVYTKVASHDSTTDQTTGANFKSTYAAYIAPTQYAGTYEGKVKYTLVHPTTESAPPSRPAELDTPGEVVGNKIKSLAAGTETTSAMLDDHIKAFRRADNLPDGFTPSDANTISSENSEHPVYIFFDNTNDAGIMYYYTEGDKVILPENSSKLFSGNTALSDISGLVDFDSSNVVNLAMAFVDTAITNVDALASWDTSNVTSLSSTFAIGLTSYNNNGIRSSLTDISGLANWDTSKVENISFIFMSAEQLTSFEAIENWNTSSVTNMNFAFAWTESATSLDLSHWDTSNLATINALFMGMESLVSINLAGWDFSKVSSLSYMFQGNNALETLDATGWNTSNVTDMSGMFAVGDNYVGNGQLREIKGIGDWDVSNVTNMTTMFYGAGNMTHYDIANWDVSKVESMNHMFCDNFKLESLDLSKWDVSNVKTMYDMFDDDRALTTLGDVSHWNTASLIDVGGFLNGATSFVGDNGTLDLSGWNTSNLKVAGEAFRATKLQTIDLTGWSFDSITNERWEGTGSGIYYETGNTQGRKGLAEMFYNASMLDTVYVSQAGLNSYNSIANSVDTTNMWTGSQATGFTVKP